MTLDINDVLKRAEDSKFWGSVEITFQDGAPIMLRKTETTKITSTKKGTTHDRTSKF